MVLAVCAALSLVGCAGARGDRDGGIAYAEPAQAALRVEWSAVPESPRPGQPITVRYRLLDSRTGYVVADLAPQLGRSIHLVAATDDLEDFVRADPEPRAQGDFAATFTPPRAGRYRLYAEFRHGGKVVLDRREPVVGAGAAGAAPPRPERGPVASGGATMNLLAPQRIGAGAVTPLTLEVLRDGRGIADLETHLGAAAHVTILSADGRTYARVTSAGVDTHSEDDQGASSAPIGPFGPRIGFTHTFSSPGLYKVWIEVRRAGQVYTVPFVVEVGR